MLKNNIVLCTRGFVCPERPGHASRHQWGQNEAITVQVLLMVRVLKVFTQDNVLSKCHNNSSLVKHFWIYYSKINKEMFSWNRRHCWARMSVDHLITLLPAGMVPKPQSQVEEARTFWPDAAGPNTLLYGIWTSTPHSTWELRSGTVTAFIWRAFEH